MLSVEMTSYPCCLVIPLLHGHVGSLLGMWLTPVRVVFGRREAEAVRFVQEDDQDDNGTY